MNTRSNSTHLSTLASQTKRLDSAGPSRHCRHGTCVLTRSPRRSRRPESDGLGPSPFPLQLLANIGRRRNRPGSNGRRLKHIHQEDVSSIRSPSTPLAPGEPIWRSPSVFARFRRFLTAVHTNRYQRRRRRISCRELLMCASCIRISSCLVATSRLDSCIVWTLFDSTRRPTHLVGRPVIRFNRLQGRGSIQAV